MSTPAPDDLPPWKAALLAIPSNQRSRSQYALARGLELASQIKHELNTPIKPFSDDDMPRILNILLAGVEAYLLGPLELSAVALLDSATQIKFRAFVNDLNTAVGDMLTTGGIPKNQILPVALAILQQSLIFISNNDPTVQLAFPDVTNFYLALVEDLPWAKLENLLPAMNVGITATGLKFAMRLTDAMLFLKDRMDVDAVRYIVIDFIEPAAHSNDPFTMATCYKVFGILWDEYEGEQDPPAPFNAVRGSEEAKELVELVWSASEACTLMAERAMATAEAAGDSARMAMAARQLSLMLLQGMRQTEVVKIRAMAQKGNSALAAAGSWLPDSHRRFLRSDVVLRTLEGMSDGEGIVATSRAYYRIKNVARPEGAKVHYLGGKGPSTSGNEKSDGGWNNHIEKKTSK